MFGPTAQENIEHLLYPLQTEGRAREPRVEMEALALLQCPPAGFRARLSVGDRASADWVQPETLVYLLRILYRNDRVEEAWDILPLLMKRSAGFIHKKLRVWRLTPQQTEDCIQAVQHQMALDLFNEGRGVEFWEIRFWLCLQRRILAIVPQHRRLADRELSLDTPYNDNESGESPLARLEDSRTIPAQTLIEMQEALSLLDEQERTAFVLFNQHQWSQQEIAERLKVTDRTVRNILHRADKRLAEWRGAN